MCGSTAEVPVIKMMFIYIIQAPSAHVKAVSPHAFCAYLFGLVVYDTVTLSCHLLGAIPDQSEVVAAAETFLEEERGAEAAHLSVGDDGDAIA